jgi:hypothetical protein
MPVPSRWSGTRLGRGGLRGGALFVGGVAVFAEGGGNLVNVATARDPVDEVLAGEAPFTACTLIVADVGCGVCKKCARVVQWFPAMHG